MSEWKVEVVQIGAIEPHPNADKLDIVRVHGGYPCIVLKGQFSPGDLAVYVPVDSLVPANDRWAFVGRDRTPKSVDGQPYYRVQAIRLRGVFSMGVLVSLPSECAGAAVGDLVHERLGILKYEPPEPMSMGGENESDPGFLPHYDIEGLRRWPNVLIPGEEVVITEKLHGCSGRWVFWKDRLWVASHGCFKKPPADEHPATVWWRIVEQYNLEAILKKVPGYAIYGEVYGQVQDLRYGVTQKGGLRLAVFDVYDITTRQWIDYDAATRFIDSLGLPLVPLLYRGPWSPALVEYAEGMSLLAVHVREGMVVKPTKERYDDRIKRVQLKLHGEGYLTRKEGK